MLLEDLKKEFQNIPSAFVTLDASHRVTGWNPGAEEIFGYSADEAIGCDIDKLITREDIAPEARRYIRRVAEGESIKAMESVRYAKDSTPIHVLLSGSPIFRGGKLEKIVAVYVDISKRKPTTESESKTSDRKYRAIFENTGTATVIVEQDTTISMVNSEFEKLSNYSKEEIEGKRSFLQHLAYREDMEKMLGYHRQRRKDSESVPRKYEVDLISSNGEIRNTLITVDMIPDTLQSIVSILDVTAYKQLQDSYKQERDYLDHILEYSPDGIAITNKRGELIRFNQIAVEISGYSFEEIQGKQAADFYAEEEARKHLLHELQEHDAVRNYEIDFLRKNGERIPCSVSISMLRDGRGEIIGSMSILRDLREWKRMLETLREEDEKFKGIAASVLDAVIMMDQQGLISYWNPAAERIFGYTAQGALNRDLHGLLAPQRYHKTFKERFAEFRRRGNGNKVGHSFELRALHRNGTEFPVEVSLSALKRNNAWHSVGIVRDISDRKIMEEKLENMANTDQLTGAYNRHKFLECLDYEIKRVKRNNASLSLVMFDIDHFKQINDSFGHGTGDEILKELVRIIRNSLRQVDILTRWGGEEFIILTPDTNKLAAAALAERLRWTVSEHEFPRVGNVTISLGIAQYGQNDTPDELISRVDERMYLAKQSGRNRVK